MRSYFIRIPKLIDRLFPKVIWRVDSSIAQYIGTTFSNPTSWQYSLLLAVLIIVFTFFYTAIMINPRKMAEDMKRSGGFIPGIKPGEETEGYIDTLVSRITLPGSLFLAIIGLYFMFKKSNPK